MFRVLFSLFLSPPPSTHRRFACGSGYILTQSLFRWLGANHDKLKLYQVGSFSFNFYRYYVCLIIRDEDDDDEDNQLLFLYFYVLILSIHLL